MSACKRLYISLLGLPNSGKSTLSDFLSGHLDATALRPRDAIWRARESQPFIKPLFAPVDDLGWSSDYALAYAVRRSIESLPSDVSTVILENLPWDALQLLDLVDLSSRTSSKLVAILIEAPDKILIGRASRRKVCQTCERDPNADPRKPAVAAADDPNRCATCERQLTVRIDDSPHLLTKRLERSRRYLAEITKYATEVKLPIYRIDGKQSVDKVQAGALEALRHFSDAAGQGLRRP